MPSNEIVRAFYDKYSFKPPKGPFWWIIKKIGLMPLFNWFFARKLKKAKKNTVDLIEIEIGDKSKPPRWGLDDINIKPIDSFHNKDGNKTKKLND